MSALWIVIFMALDNDIPTLASYAKELQTESNLADFLIQSLSSDHVRLPSVLCFMGLAALWAPVIDNKLAAKEKQNGR